MNSTPTEDLLRVSLQEEAAEVAPAAPDLADRVLRAGARRRTRRFVGAGAAVAVVTALAILVPQAVNGGGGAGPAQVAERMDVVGHPDQSPPRELIAAGGTAVAAWYTTDWVEQPGGDRILTSTYHLYNPTTGRYGQVPWAFVAVAPGMRTAAVLEGELPARRIGVVDLASGKVQRWIPVDRPVGGLEYAPDGKRLLATTYAKNPDRTFKDKPRSVNDEVLPGPDPSRTGFGVVDLGSGKGSWHDVGYAGSEMDRALVNSREDFGWTHDGRQVHTTDVGTTSYYDLSGAKTSTPAAERHVGYVIAGFSPNGKLIGGPMTDSGRIESAVIDPVTGETKAVVPGQQLLAWADNRRLFAWGCDPAACSGKGEFRNRLLLVEIGKDSAVPLSNFRKPNDAAPGRWTPVFASRH